MKLLPHATLYAIGAALLFGASTPLAKVLGDNNLPNSPFMLAGLLYLGSGLGLTLLRLLRDRGWQTGGIQRHEWPWLLGTIGFGGIVGPVLLMLGLAHSTATSASLLLNLEAVLTALLAWLVWREATDRRMVLGMALIVAGSAVLVWPPEALTLTDWVGPAALAGACLAWAIDNNLTRQVAHGDALFIALSKGLLAGAVNCALGWALGASLPAGWLPLGLILAVGFLGYGMSLVLFVLALRGLGTARTGAYFSTAPFVGAAIAMIWLGEPASTGLGLAGALMAAGVALHLSERHTHLHTHAAQLHNHAHRHDSHHQHTHDLTWDGTEPHTHPHTHAPLTHRHTHFPDSLHRHSHGS
ncbi:MAG: EamA family transporter [Rhodoferax sp.]|nr:EamA family transporter [Rhodoferax sp.]